MGLTGKELMNSKDKSKECAKDKDLSSDIPQDYFPFPPSSPENLPKDSPVGVCSTADAHTWVSPNKSDEISSSKESSPDIAPEKPVIRENEKSEEQLNVKDSISSIKTNLEAVDIEPNATEEQSGFDMTISGEGLKIQKNNPSFIAKEAVFAPHKDFVKIAHGGKEIMLVLPSESCELDSTLELSEILAESLNITDDIVGLKTTALILDDESFKHHGDMVIPFSSLVSGQLSTILRRDGNGIGGIPSFDLVISSLDPCIESNRVKGSAGLEEECWSKDSSIVSTKDGVLYTEAFVKLMENSNEFNPFEKNSLLRFGIDKSEQASILYGAAFRVAVYTGDMKYFVQGLKTIAKVLHGTKALSSSANDISDCTIANTKPTSVTIFGLTDFVISTDELFDSNDITAQCYVTLLNAIFLGHSSVQSLFDLYHDPDFLLACDSDKDLRQSLCMRDLLHLGKKLVLDQPLQPQSQSQHDEDLLKWAVKTGLHNFVASMSTDVPQEFINIIYHMFSSGDEMVLAACNKFVDMGDGDPIEEMLRREWDIFCCNKSFQKEISGNISDQHPAESLETVSEPSYKSSDNCAGEHSPNIIRTAMAYLVDSNDISEEKAATVITSFIKGNQLLRDICDHFINFGDVDDFLNMMRQAVAAVTEAPGTCQDAAAVLSNVTKNTDNAFQNFLKENIPFLGQLEIAALHLAGVRKDPELAQALTDFRDGKTDSTLFYNSILNVVKKIVQEVDEVETSG